MSVASFSVEDSDPILLLASSHGKINTTFLLSFSVSKVRMALLMAFLFTLFLMLCVYLPFLVTMWRVL